MHRSFSKASIAKYLKESGFRWRKLPQRRKRPLYDPPDSTRVRTIISKLAQSLDQKEVVTLYCDEIKFPLYQTPTHAWHKLENHEEIVYNRRDAINTTLTVIALCSVERFIAVQVFREEVTGAGFLYFLAEASKKLDQSKRYIILADNATWHTANVVQKSSIFKVLLFNVQRCFMLNLIESAFSFVRAEFRKRPMLETIEDEARYITGIFFQPENKRRFEGLYRNHLRQLILFLKKHTSIEQTIQQSGFEVSQLIED